MVLVNFLEWRGNVVGGALNVESLNDAKKGTSDGGVTGFVSEVFGVTADQVRCSRTDAGHPALQLVPAGGIPAPRVAPGFFRNQPGMLPGDVAPPPAPAPAPAVKPRDPYRLGWGARLLPVGANRPADGNWSESGPGWRAGTDPEPIVAKPDSATMPADAFEAAPWFWSDARGIQKTLVYVIKYHGAVELQDVSVTLSVTADDSSEIFNLGRPARTIQFKPIRFERWKQGEIKEVPCEFPPTRVSALFATELDNDQVLRLGVSGTAFRGTTQVNLKAEFSAPERSLMHP
jgi:hypothetical protein